MALLPTDHEVLRRGSKRRVFIHAVVSRVGLAVLLCLRAVSVLDPNNVQLSISSWDSQIVSDLH